MVRASMKTWAIVLLGAAQSVSAHTWVETVRRIGENGSFVGEPGYAMGYIPRTDPGFADPKVQNQMLDKKADAPICRQFDGRGDYSNPQYQPITASAGDFLALQYLENGHVTDPNLTPRPYRGGNVYVYGSKTAGKSVTLQNIIGDKKRDDLKLLSSHFFDDGQCFQARQETPQDAAAYPVWAERSAKHGNTELACQNDVQLPHDLPESGEYTLYWFWAWPQHPNTPQEVWESYSSCVTIKLGPSKVAAKSKVVKFAKNLDARDGAIQSQIKTPIEATALGTDKAAPAAPTGQPSAPAPNNPSSPAASSAPAPSPTANQPSNGITTVTVTADPKTVTDFITVTVGAGAEQTRVPGVPAESTTTLQTSVRSGGLPSQASGTPSQATGYAMTFSVMPFMKPTGQARRAAAATPSV